MEKNEALILFALFFATILMSSAFVFDDVYHPEGDTIGTRFTLYGPDPYYNLRLAEELYDNGNYIRGQDYLLNYPDDSFGSRPPLYTYITVTISKILTPIMGKIDAIGWSMLMLPVIYGSLIVFPLYYLGKEMFHKKVGLIAACLFPLVPMMVAGAHGTMLGLYDHDSLLFLLFTCIFYFYVKTIKNDKLVYPIIAGILMSLVMGIWVVGQTIFVMIAVFLFVNLIIDLFKETYDVQFQIRNMFVIIIGFSLSYIWYPISSIPMFVLLFSLILLVVYIVQDKLRVSYLITIPAVVLSSFLMLVLVYAFPIFSEVKDTIFGDRIYGSKIDLTIAEGSVMSVTTLTYHFGPILFWCVFAGVVIFAYRYYNGKIQADDTFLITMFVILLFFTTRAGRFVSDAVPLMLIFASFFIWFAIARIDWKSFKKGAVRPMHIMVIIFVGMLFISNGSLAVITGNSTTHKIENRWSEVCDWLVQQDTEIENPADRPAVLSWWDYGFYIVSMGKHPTVADNFQRGLYVSSNFFTATSEEEAIAVLIVRMIEGAQNNISEEIVNLVGEDVTSIIREPTVYTTSTDMIIQPEWHNFTGDLVEVSYQNAMYWDSTNILIDRDVDELFDIYNDVCEITGKRIKYIATDERDMELLPAMTFTSDKGIWILTGEDDYHVGRAAIKKDACNETILFQLHKGVNLKHFKPIVNIEGVRIFKIE